MLHGRNCETEVDFIIRGITVKIRVIHILAPIGVISFFPLRIDSKIFAGLVEGSAERGGASCSFKCAVEIEYAELTGAAWERDDANTISRGPPGVNLSVLLGQLRTSTGFTDLECD